MPVKTYRARRPVNMGAEGVRLPGQLIPEACAFYLLDSLIHVGKIVAVEVPNAEFLAAIDQFCPDRKAELCAKAGLVDEPQPPAPPAPPAAGRPAPGKPAPGKVAAQRVKGRRKPAAAQTAG